MFCRKKFESIRHFFQVIFTPLPPPLSLFLTVDRPLGINFYSPQPFDAIKIKDGGQNIRYEITKHSLTKITPALPPPLSLVLTVDHPLGLNVYSPQPFAAIKIKNGG